MSGFNLSITSATLSAASSSIRINPRSGKRKRCTCELGSDEERGRVGKFFLSKLPLSEVISGCQPHAVHFGTRF